MLFIRHEHEVYASLSSYDRQLPCITHIIVLQELFICPAFDVLLYGVRNMFILSHRAMLFVCHSLGASSHWVFLSFFYFGSPPPPKNRGLVLKLFCELLYALSRSLKLSHAGFTRPQNIKHVYVYRVPNMLKVVPTLGKTQAH